MTPIEFSRWRHRAWQMIPRSFPDAARKGSLGLYDKVVDRLDRTYSPILGSWWRSTMRIEFEPHPPSHPTIINQVREQL